MPGAVIGTPAYCNATVAKKVMYEYSMLVFLHGILQSRAMESYAFAPGEVKYAGTGAETDDNFRTTYAFLESYLIHARVLHDFFYKEPIKDDIVAAHFVPDWDHLKPPLHAYLATDDRRNRLDKSVAHLTLKRLEYDLGDKRWNIDAIHEAIDQPMRCFEITSPTRKRPGLQIGSQKWTDRAVSLSWYR